MKFYFLTNTVKEDDPLAFDVLVDDQPLMYLRAFSNRFARIEHVFVCNSHFIHSLSANASSG